MKTSSLYVTTKNKLHITPFAILMHPPLDFGYTQPMWDGALVSQYLAKRFKIEYTVRHCQRLMNNPDFSLQRGRKKYARVDPKEQFKEDLKILL